MSDKIKNRVVIKSLQDQDGLRCVDLFQINNGTISWDEWRRDPEDPSGWRPTGRRSATEFFEQDDALEEAIKYVEWLKR